MFWAKMPRILGRGPEVPVERAGEDMNGQGVKVTKTLTERIQTLTVEVHWRVTG